MDMEKDQACQLHHTFFNWFIMVRPGNILWMGFLPVYRMALAGFGKTRKSQSAIFLYQIFAVQVNKA